MIAKNQRFETLIYGGLWLIAVTLFLLDIMRERSFTEMPLLDTAAVGRLILTLLPFMALFALNNYLLIPRLLKPGHVTKYFLLVGCLIAGVWLWQKYQFFSFVENGAFPRHRHAPHGGPHPLLPLPLFLDVIYDFLIVGVNLAISLLFQHFADRLQHESLMKENAENRLTYLKAQINPHFYMNMLNNIHGMIEIDPAKAQDMVIEMSGLMRYTLYESSRPLIELSSEIGFISDYLALMRVRYPEDTVTIDATFPQNDDIAGARVPPLIFLVFLENAFKHGISYLGKSFVTVSITVKGGNISFCCLNSDHQPEKAAVHHGIGLGNAKRRLDIIYGDRYSLKIKQTNSSYKVNLCIPAYETTDVDN